MRKLVGLLLAISMFAVMVSSCSASDEPIVAPLSEIPFNTLTVGTQEMVGDFISGFGSNAYDLSIVTLVNGHMNTYGTTAEGEIMLNSTVVENVAVSEDSAGNKVYTYTLYDDLLWNNGDSITAKDYVASVLFLSSPEWVEVGAKSTDYDGLLGYSEYFSGETQVFKGVQLIDELNFSITLSAELLPYYWEEFNLSVRPIHSDTYLPSAEIVSTADGSSLEFSEGDLLSSCSNIASVERYAPSVTCGPYSFVSFENQTVTLEINENFKGDMYGDKPEFQYVIQKAIPIESDVQWVIDGQVDIVEGVVEHEKIEAVKSSDTANFQTYLRAGFGYLAMLCDTGVTSDINVRWALASLIDRSAVVEYVLGGYGSTVDAEYGIGQWMYRERGADLQEEMLPISFNIDVANDYLDETEWVYESDGTTAFDREKASADGSYMRHNADGEKLVINHLGQSNVLTDIIEIQYAANAPLAGMEFNLETGDWNAVLANYYNAYQLGEDRIYDTFNLATNFSPIFDRYYDWHSDSLESGSNRAQLSDAELDEYIVAMRSADPSEREEYLDAWVNYQLRWNELLPQIPLYSNEYFDISHIYVDNFETNTFAGYENIICQISKSEK